MNIFKTNNLFRFFSIFFIFLFLFSFTSAVPPVTQIQEFSEGFVIEPSPTIYIEQNQDYTINFFLYNISNGVVIDNKSVSCEFYLADNQGTLIHSSNVDYTTYWNKNIAGGNFSELGHYPYGIHCNSSSLGGSYIEYFEVTPSGQGGNSNIVFFIFVILLIYGMTLISFYNGNIPMTIASGMAMLFLGVYLVTHGIIIYRDNLTNYIAYLTIIIGAITSAWATLEQLEVL